ncbi:hypothetical protein [Tardiphaga sp. 709]|uniref:hypothetical protein n=1 Tax=Tardiphaga sp. 709 TaxID=3076039 RepID=UPI0028E66830|nr:hypothetical protein [Tardiphaga sp. 709]WNV11590.1 hypothetical protein RSO67_10630 [Tardiphaga sp. 709]
MIGLIEKQRPTHIGNGAVVCLPVVLVDDIRPLAAGHSLSRQNSVNIRKLLVSTLVASRINLKNHVSCQYYSFAKRSRPWAPKLRFSTLEHDCVRQLIGARGFLFLGFPRMTRTRSAAKAEVL